MIKDIAKPVRGSSTGRPIMRLFDVLGERWTLRILWELKQETLNFRALRERCDNVSPTSLNKRLKVLREMNLVRHDNEGYSLSEAGQSLGSQLMGLHEWAETWATSLAPPISPTD